MEERKRDRGRQVSGSSMLIRINKVFIHLNRLGLCCCCCCCSSSAAADKMMMKMMMMMIMMAIMMMII